LPSLWGSWGMGKSEIYPPNWIPKALGEVCDISIGGTPSRNQSSFWAEGDEGYPWAAISDMGPKFITKTNEKITRSGIINSNAKYVHSGTTLMSFKLTLGRVGIAGIDLYTNEAIAAFVPKSENVNSRWLYHVLPRVVISTTAEQAIKGQTLNKKKLNRLRVHIPSSLEQRRIAEILDTIDEAIQKTEALISKLKAMKQGLLHDLLTRGFDKNGKLRDPKAHPEQFKDSPLGRIPREWEVITIGKIAIHVGSGLTPRGGSEVYKTSGVIFIRSQNVTFDGLKLADIAFIDSKTHEQMQRSEVFANDVLLNITGASIGRCCPLPEGLGPTNVNQHVCAIRLPSPRREDAFYLSSVLSSHIGQHQIDVLNAGGNREGLNYQQLRSFVIPWPEKDERTKAANIIAAHDARIRTEEQYCDKLKLQKKGLMHDLLTGKVRVKI